MNSLFQKMGLHVDETTFGGTLREFAPRGRLPILEYMTEAVFDALPNPDREKLRGRIFAGDFPTGDFNAHAVRVPDGTGYVFLLNVGLMSLIYDTAKLLLSQSRWATFDQGGNPIQGTETGRSEISYKEAGQSLRDMIYNYVKLKEWTPPQERFVIKDETRNLILGMLALAADKFVLAHEFGHAILGHLDRSQCCSISVPDVGITLSVVSKSYEDEFTADLVAGALILESLPKEISNRHEAFTAEVSVAGPFLFFEIARLIEKVAEAKYVTHPPTGQRYQVLKTAFRKPLPEQAFSFTKSVVTLLQSFEQFL